MERAACFPSPHLSLHSHPQPGFANAEHTCTRLAHTWPLIWLPAASLCPHPRLSQVPSAAASAAAGAANAPNKILFVQNLPETSNEAMLGMLFQVGRFWGRGMGRGVSFTIPVRTEAED